MQEEWKTIFRVCSHERLLSRGVGLPQVPELKKSWFHMQIDSSGGQGQAYRMAVKSVKTEMADRGRVLEENDNFISLASSCSSSALWLNLTKFSVHKVSSPWSSAGIVFIQQ